MVKITGVCKVDGTDDPPKFVLSSSSDVEEKDNKGYFMSTREGTEEQLRRELKDSDISPIELDRWFRSASVCP